MRTTIFIMGVMIIIWAGMFRGELYPCDTGGYWEGEFIEPLGDDAFMNWTTKVLRVKGYGFGPDRVTDLGRRKLLAKRAAKADAYRNVMETVKGVQVAANTRVEDMMLVSDSIRSKTGGMVKGMQVVEVIYSEDGACEITLEVNIDRDGAFFLREIYTDDFRVVDNYPEFDWNAVRSDLEKTKKQLVQTRSQNIKLKEELQQKENELRNNQRNLGGQLGNNTILTGSDKSLDSVAQVQPAQMNPSYKSQIENSYTGLLVDATELKLKPSLAPSILNPKKEKLYGLGVIPATATSGSIVDYLPGTVEHARKYKKIFDFPLVVKGIAVENETDVVISNEDGQKLTLIRHLLEQGKVVILI